MIQVRKGFFETNSSSSHSLSISKHKLPEYDISHMTKEEQRVMKRINGGKYLVCALTPDKGSVLRLDCNKTFGWELAKYNSAAIKAIYLYISQRDNDNNIKMLNEVIMKQTGAVRVITNDLYSGEIDHQSMFITDDLFKDEKELRNFIFNKKCILITDNDNH